MYLRKSRAGGELGYGNTPERHGEMPRDLAAQTGMHVGESHVYREIVSGEGIEASPQVQRPLKAVEMGLCTGVLRMEPERLGRGDGADRQGILKAFRFSDAKTATLAETYGLAGDGSLDGGFFGFGLFMSRREYEMIERRLYRGRIQAQEEGYSIGSRPPCGYSKRRIGKGHVPVPNENAEAVRYVFRRHARRGTAANILHGLDDMAIPTVTGTKWTACAIREAIENQTCIGKIDTETVRCEKSIRDGKAVRRRLDDCGPAAVEGRHEPIADEGPFWKCREVRDGKKTGSDPTLKNPPASPMSCGVCGETIRRTHRGYRGERTFCYGCVTSRCETEDAFTHAVYGMATAGLRNELGRRQAMLADCGTAPGHGGRKDGLEMPKAELGEKSMVPERACEAYGTGIYGRQTYSERVRKVDAARAGPHARVGELEAGIGERHGKAVPILTEAVDEMHALEPKGQNGLPKMIIGRIEYGKAGSGAAIGPTPRIGLEI